jgi:translocation and assembly module TamB
MEANGSLPGGITLNADMTHVPAGLAPSRVTVRGTVMGSKENLFLNLRGELAPLSFSSMKRFFPDLPLTGDISGPVAVRGYLDSLDVEAELLTSAGPLGLEAWFDALRPADGYAVDSEFQEFLLSSLVPALPEPTRVTGRVALSGQGLKPDAVAGSAEIYLRRGEVGYVRVDTVAVSARIENGLLLVDDFLAETNVGDLGARGTFGIASDAEDGDLIVEMESPSLEGLRPFFMGEVPLIREDLTSFDRDLLAAEGVNPDTIPSAEDVAMGGSLRGRVGLRGGIRDFSGEGSVEADSLVYRTDYLRAGTVTFSARGLPGETYRIEGLLGADSIKIGGFEFQGGEVEMEMGRRDGRFRVRATRGIREEYAARGTFVVDSLGGQVNLDELNIEFDTIRWNLGGPSSFEWNPDGVRVRDFRLIRPGRGNMRIRADGLVPFRGDGAFALGIEGLELDRLASLIQMEEPLDGVANLDLHIQGTADEPSIQGTFSGDSLRYDVFSLDALDAEFAYEDHRLSGEVWASQGGRQVLAAEGSIPADMRVHATGSRFPDGAVDLDVAVDSFPAALALVVVEGLEDVQGSVSGRVKLGGSRDELAPSGDLRLRDGSALIPALGVRFQDIQTGFDLHPDGSVEVDGTFRSEGSGRVTGTVTLHPLVDPALDLTVNASNLLATARRDLRASLSGEVQVLQTYRKPRIEGSLTVERGVLMVEELARSADVVDLSDPSFMNVVEEEATLRPVVEANQNPFLQNLMLAVDVSLARDSWLRGQDLNVEMDGELQVFWDRIERNLAMVGELEAVRGYYTVLGRQFQVQGGTVSFLGTPGVNPSLDIQALHRIRTVEEDENLEIIANVGGTLMTPRVSLTSNARYGIAESDLVSYLIFGRPSYALASGQNRWIRGATGSLLGAAGGAGLNFTLGTVGSQLGSVVARDFGLDYLTISQGEYVDPLGVPDWYGTLATTQVEIGQYLTDNVFAVLMWRPLSHVGSTDRQQFAGLRLEWQLANFWTLEGFIEDRFMRSPLFTAGVGGANSDKIKGFSFWREWGY